MRSGDNARLAMHQMAKYLGKNLKEIRHMSVEDFNSWQAYRIHTEKNG